MDDWGNRRLNFLMSFEAAKLEVRRLLPQMPEEIFQLWLDGRIEANGWPPFGSIWENTLRNHPLLVWQRFQWKKEMLRLNLDNLSPATLEIVCGLARAYSDNSHNTYTRYVGDSHERFASIENYMRQHRQLPSTLVFLSDKSIFDVVDGCHRLAVFFSWRNNPEFRDLISDGQIAWVGYRKAAEQGDVLAQYFLGQSYNLGDGVAIDKAEAVKWWRKSAEKGYADSQYSLGVCYYQGKGLTNDIVEAVKWFRRAAEQSGMNTEAQYNLGCLYSKGEGVLIDYVEAYKWFNLASANGNIDAKKGLSIVEQLMTPEQIAEGQKLAREFKPHIEFNPSRSSERMVLNPYLAARAFSSRTTVI
jgi:TPR repeat protein